MTLAVIQQYIGDRWVDLLEDVDLLLGNEPTDQNKSRAVMVLFEQMGRMVNPKIEFNNMHGVGIRLVPNQGPVKVTWKTN